LNNKLDIDILIIDESNPDHLAEVAWYEILDEVEKLVPLLLDTSTREFWQGEVVLNKLNKLST